MRGKQGIEEDPIHGSNLYAMPPGKSHMRGWFKLSLTSLPSYPHLTLKCARAVHRNWKLLYKELLLWKRNIHPLIRATSFHTCLHVCMQAYIKKEQKISRAYLSEGNWMKVTTGSRYPSFSCDNSSALVDQDRSSWKAAAEAADLKFDPCMTTSSAGISDRYGAGEWRPDEFAESASRPSCIQWFRPCSLPILTTSRTVAANSSQLPG